MKVVTKYSSFNTMTIMHQYITNIVLLLFFLSLTSLHAQDTLTVAQDSLLPEKEVEVIKSFEARISKAKRVSINPELPAVNTTPRYYQYDVSIVPIDINYPDPEIRPLAMKPDPEAEHNHGFLHLAGGSLQGIDASVGYYYHHEDKYRIGSQLDFYNVADSNEIDNIKSQQLKALLYGQYDWTDIYKVNAKLGGQLHKVELRGAGDNPRTINQVYLSTGLEKISEEYEELAGKFDLDIGYTSVDSLNEFYTKTPLHLNKPLSDFSGIELNANTELNIPSQNNLDGDFIYGGGLAFYHLLKGASIRVGVDYLGHDSEQSLFPDIEIAYPLSNNLITPFVKTDQYYSKNSLSNILNQNPYFSGAMDSIRTNVVQKISGGVRGLFSNELQYEIEAGYKNIKNQVSYQGFTSLALRQNDLSAIFFATNLEWNLRDWIKIDLSGQKLFFQDEPFFGIQNVPDLEVKLLANLSTNHELYYFKNEVIYLDGIQYLGLDDGQIDLDPFIKWDIAAGYHIKENIELYAEGNNILNLTNARWSGYEGFGFQILGGVKVVF